MCAQEKLCVIKIIKVIDRVSRSKLDPFDLLQIQEIYFLCRRRLSTVLDTVERLFYCSPSSPFSMDGREELSTL